MCHFIGWPITEVQLKEAAVHSGILQVEEDFIDRTFRTKCEEIIPYPDRVEPQGKSLRKLSGHVSSHALFRLGHQFYYSFIKNNAKVHPKCINNMTDSQMS